MDCVNHSGVKATTYCQSCGKGLCSTCTRNAPGGQVFCEPCAATWQAYTQPFAGGFSSSGPNPSAAAVLGLIPGVGAMYNGQFFKGLIHVVIFAVLVSVASSHGIFGIFIGAWVLYQSFEAFHTAKALRAGQAPPDPLGLNEVGNWLNLGSRQQNPGQPGPGPFGAAPGAPGQPAQGQASGYPPPYGAQWQDPTPGPAQPSWQQVPNAPPPPSGFPDPTMPPVPPPAWQRREPIGAIVLIGLGILFLLGQMDLFSDRLFEYAWPVGLIGLGAWLMVRRLGHTQGGSK